MARAFRIVLKFKDGDTIASSDNITTHDKARKLLADLKKDWRFHGKAPTISQVHRYIADANGRIR